MKINSVTIFRKGVGLQTLTPKQWAELLQEKIEGETIQIVKVDY